MGKALISCLWLAVAMSACTLDTRAGGAGAAVSEQCGGSDNPCDSGTSSSAPSGDAATPTTGQADITPVMTGRGNSGTDVSANVGGMSSEPPDASAPPPPPPPPKKTDGETCGADVECVSGHCLHDICCEGGDCCRSAADCPKTIVDGIQLACNEPSTCQGMGGQVSCENFLCVAHGDMPNDSACTTQHLAKDCAPYKPVFCNGMTEQQEPLCPSSCNSDDACIDQAHCDTASGTCVQDADDGAACSVDKDCASNHCNRGICCKAGDCCRTADACFWYNTAPMCVDANTCRGSMKLAMCKANQCTNEEMSSPSACNDTVVERCGLYLDSVCRAGVHPPCATSCSMDSHCKSNAYCKVTSQGGTCEPKLKDGASCSGPTQCEHSCNHGFCCGDSNPDTYCCGASENCAVLNKSQCVGDPNSCDGESLSGVCTPEHRCRVETRPDPNACTNRTVDCGPGYTERAACPLGCGCSVQLDCAAGYVCDKSAGGTRGKCSPDPDLGMTPSMPNAPNAPNAPMTPGSAGAPAPPSSP